MLRFISPLLLLLMLSSPVAALDEKLADFSRKLTDLNITDEKIISELTSLFRRIPSCDLDEAFVYVRESTSKGDLRHVLNSYIPGTEEEDDRLARTMCLGFPWFLAEVFDGGLDKYE